MTEKSGFDVFEHELPCKNLLFLKRKNDKIVLKKSIRTYTNEWKIIQQLQIFEIEEKRHF